VSRLRIVAVDVIPVDVPRRDVIELQRGTTPPSSPFTVVRIRTDGGVTGYGEGVTTARGIHSFAVEHLVDLLIGADPFDLTGIHQRMDQIEMMKNERLAHWNPIRAAIDIALHDLRARALGVPLYELLGGKQRDSFEVCKNIGVSDPATSAERAQRLVADGYRVVKMRVGTDVDLDVARVRAVREAVGEGVGIRVDANQAWDPTTAVAAINRMARSGLEGVEQPCKFWDLRAAAEVVARVDVPVIADEGFWTVDDAQRLLSARGADVLHLYLGKCGGIQPSMKIVAVAEAFGATTTLGERIPLGIAEAAHAHVAAALPESRFAHALAYDINEDDLIVSPVRRERGRMYVPDGPGLGVEVDEEKLAYYARRRAEQ
jgi:L-alanine-DL-glutamate epimerase-like enolase superfamily enzyme